MSQPTILAVDDDREVAWPLERDLGKRYAADYHVIVERSPSAVLGRRQQVHDRSADVALVIAGLCLPQ